jgi:hypothetical protein
MRASRVAGHTGSLMLHVLVFVCMLWTTSRVVVRAPGSPPADAVDVVVVAAPPLPQLPGLNPIDISQDDSVVRPVEGSTVVALPGFTYDFRRVAGRATLLFPFLTPGLALDRFVPAAPREIKASFYDPAPPSKGRSGASEKPPLALSNASAQTLIDRCWSRRDRWGAFQPLVALTAAYNPDLGDLAAVLHKYVQENGLQPYVDTTIKDARLWVELGLAADHVEFIAFISRYASEHPSTKTTIELLFLLDKLAQGSVDALVTLLDVDPMRDLAWTRNVNIGAFRRLVEIRRFYQAQLERRGLDSAMALRRHYEKVRLTILTRILETTPHGYHAGDARYLIGVIHWAGGRTADALQSWRNIVVDPTDAYVAAYSDILAAIRDASGGTVDTGRVERALKSEHSRWVSASIDRLRQFGYHVDTF